MRRAPSDHRTRHAHVLSGVVAGLLTAVLLTRLVAGLARPWGWQKGASWLRQATSVTFAASGRHVIRVQVREEGAQIDQIVLSPSRYLRTPPGTARDDTTIVDKP
jgi:uncharacterized membrane protein YjgN (DUF898 family)